MISLRKARKKTPKGPVNHHVSYLLVPTERDLKKSADTNSESSRSYTSACNSSPLGTGSGTGVGKNSNNTHNSLPATTTGTISSLHIHVPSAYHNEALSRQNSTNSNCSTASTRNKDRLVYDPVFGVIPQETRDLWHAQEENAVQKKAFLDAQSGNKHVPPVRFTGGNTSTVS